jgi:hypothetical protein
LLVIGQDDHVLALVAKVLVQVAAHVLDVVDAASQLALLAKVVDSNEQGFPSAGTVGVLKGVASGGALAKGLGLARRRGGRGVVSLDVSIVVDGGKGCKLEWVFFFKGISDKNITWPRAGIRLRGRSGAEILLRRGLDEVRESRIWTCCSLYWFALHPWLLPTLAQLPKSIKTAGEMIPDDVRLEESRNVWVEVSHG